MDASTTIRLPSLRVLKTEAPADEPVVASVAGELSDECLMARVGEQGGEELALLFRRYSRLVRGVALRILRDASEADDLLQEVFLFVHRKARVFDPSKASVRSWIVQMTYQRAIDRRRYLQSRHFYTRLDLEEGAEDLAGDRSGREEGELWTSLVGKATIGGLLDTLTPDQRNTLVLYFFEGYVFAEIAERLDQSLGNIRNHYYRGLECLRKQMFPRKLPGRNGCGRK
jgi:RNA polymerase sigma-70 factor (ECF subfamily)